MKALKNLFDRIIQKVNINLRELNFDVTPYVAELLSLKQLSKFYAFYGITPHHPLNFEFRHSNLAGSYFLGKCRTADAIVYKSDVRGDELKKEGDAFRFQDFEIQMQQDECIEIKDSLIIKTLVHNFSHDPETLEKFFITNTLSAHYANIHGSPTNGTFIAPFATMDLTTVNDCVIGAYAYVQAGEIAHMEIEPGTVWVRNPGIFNFLYKYPQEKLTPYIHFSAGKPPQGMLMDFVEQRKTAFHQIFNVVNRKPIVSVPKTASLDRFAVVDPETRISENVLVAQRAYLERAWLGNGANAQENCYIINARLEGNNVMAHGAKLIETDLGPNVFVGFNSFLRGQPNCRLSIGEGSIIMPHTIIDIQKPLNIPLGHLVWGLINDQSDIETHSISLKDFSKIHDRLYLGDMYFEGKGADFVSAFQNRIHHILEANGAFYHKGKNRGHAQKNQNISFNTVQPYPEGSQAGMFPTILIQP